MSAETTKDDREVGVFHLVDENNEPIEIRQLRGKTSGDVFLSNDVDDMPPQGARFEMTVRGEVKGKIEFEEKGDHWVAFTKLVVNERKSFRILQREENEPDLFDDVRWKEAVTTLEDTFPDLPASKFTDAAEKARDHGWPIERFTKVAAAGAATAIGPEAAVELAVLIVTTTWTSPRPTTERIWARCDRRASGAGDLVHRLGHPGAEGEQERVPHPSEVRAHGGRRRRGQDRPPEGLVPAHRGGRAAARSRRRPDARRAARGRDRVLPDEAEEVPRSVGARGPTASPTSPSFSERSRTR